MKKPPPVAFAGGGLVENFGGCCLSIRLDPRRRAYADDYYVDYDYQVDGRRLRQSAVAVQAVIVAEVGHEWTKAEEESQKRTAIIDAKHGRVQARGRRSGTLRQKKLSPLPQRRLFRRLPGAAFAAPARGPGTAPDRPAWLSARNLRRQ